MSHPFIRGENISLLLLRLHVHLSCSRLRYKTHSNSKMSPRPCTFSFNPKNSRQKPTWQEASFTILCCWWYPDVVLFKVLFELLLHHCNHRSVSMTTVSVNAPAKTLRSHHRVQDPSPVLVFWWCPSSPPSRFKSFCPTYTPEVPLSLCDCMCHHTRGCLAAAVHWQSVTRQPAATNVMLMNRIWRGWRSMTSEFMMRMMMLVW